MYLHNIFFAGQSILGSSCPMILLPALEFYQYTVEFHPQQLLWLWSCSCEKSLRSTTNL